MRYPQQGDLVYIGFDPTVGNEIQKRSPALVVSIDDFNMATGFAVVCPITSTVRGFPSEVVLDERTQIQGAILTHKENSLDYRQRNFYFIEKCPDDLVLETIDKIKQIFEE